MSEEDDAHAAGRLDRGGAERLRARYGAWAEDPSRARRWSAANAGNRAIADELAAAVLPFAGGAHRVIDIGCGTGWWLERLVRAGLPAASLAGADLIEARVESARDRVPGADVRLADARALPWENGGADLVTLLLVLSSMEGDESRRAALAEARRLARPGGRIVVWEPRVPTGTRETQRVSVRLICESLGPHIEATPITLLPPLARRVGPVAYARLARVRPMLTHRLVVASV